MAKRALLIGINDYQVPGASLDGCVNDVNALHEVLRNDYAFDEITKLIDKQATQTRILESLATAVRNTASGDVLLVHFSGHGSNLPDRSGDEADFREEILCPYDLDWRDPFNTRRLRRTLNALPDGVNCTFITDCAFSGTVTRMMSTPGATISQRYFPSPWDLIATESGRRLSGQLYDDTSLEGSSQNRAIVTITAAGFEQPAVEVRTDDGCFGLLTRNLVEFARESAGDISYRDLHEKVLRAIELDKRSSQRPELHGLAENLEMPFLSAFPTTHREAADAMMPSQLF